MNYKRTGPTIYDIAELAGVSPATVSRVLNNASYPVSEQARQKVVAAADQLRYNFKNKGLSSQRDVVVMLPNLSNPCYTDLLAGVESSLRMFGLNTLLMNTKGSIALEQELVQELRSRNSLRLILSPVSDDLHHLQPLIESGIPMIMLEQPYVRGVSTICDNYLKCGAIATEYLLQRNLRRIAFLGAPLKRHTRSQHFDGYRTSLKKFGLPIDPSYVFLAEEEPSARDDISPFHMGFQLAQRMLDACNPLPDGIVCGNDMTALGALHCLHQHGIRVPTDISIIGCDNIYSAAISYPPLTTIDQSAYETGCMAAEMLYGLMRDPSRQHVNNVLEPKLIVRGSVI